MFKSQSLLTRRAMFCRTGRSVALCSLKRQYYVKSPKLRIPLSCYYDRIMNVLSVVHAGADLGEGCRGAQPPPPPEITCGFLIQLVLCKKKTVWFIGVEVEQETSAPPPKKS